jgi:hypothetical protein
MVDGTTDSSAADGADGMVGSTDIMTDSAAGGAADGAIGGAAGDAADGTADSATVKTAVSVDGSVGERGSIR